MFIRFFKNVYLIQYNKYNTTNKLPIMKLVLIQNNLYNLAQKNTKVACTYIFRRLMRLRGGMSAIQFIDLCGH